MDNLELLKQSILDIHTDLSKYSTKVDTNIDTLTTLINAVVKDVKELKEKYTLLEQQVILLQRLVILDTKIDINKILNTMSASINIDSSETDKLSDTVKKDIVIQQENDVSKEDNNFSTTRDDDLNEWKKI